MADNKYPAAGRDREFSKLVWAVPLTIIIHNTEEALTMPRWIMEYLPAVALRFYIRISRVPTAEELRTALAITALVSLLVAFIAFLSGPRSLALYLLAGIQGTMLANAFFPHLIGSIVLRGYTPGVITAVVVIIPFSLFWFRRILQRGFAERRPLIIALIVGVLAYPLVMAALYEVSDLV
jgi:hypothetical protein